MSIALSTRKLPAGAVEATLGGLSVVLREKDGYVNATRLCQDGGKQLYNWRQNDKTKAFLECLSSTTGLPADQLVEARNDRLPRPGTRPLLVIQ